MVKKQIVEIFTDGSCNSKYKIGAWAAIIFYEGKKEILDGIEEDTTHNIMELMAVIEAIKYVIKTYPGFELIRICTDSQYAEKIPLRAKKLIATNFTTNKGNDIQNKNLVKTLILLIQKTNIEFVKVKAHQKLTATENYNREVDKHARKLVRQEVDKNECLE
ncbi:MAG TPA: RNase H family protein [Bacteroidales bacterium]|nr:RNase H family protein [Bacteroidales bacterium]